MCSGRAGHHQCRESGWTDSTHPAAIDGWAAPSGQGSSPFRHSPGLVERSAKKHLDLGVRAAELIGRPTSQGIMDCWIKPQKYLLTVIHGSRVETAGIDDWRSRLVTAKYDHQVADH